MSEGVERWAGRVRTLLRRAASSYVLVLVVGVAVGLQVAPYAWSVGAQTGTSGTVAVVPLEGTITGTSAAAVSASLREARTDPSVEAVVLAVNSPGGGASASETLYLQVSHTAAEMPVVASVDALAASGGYYALAPADYAYAKPASLVGSVGTYVSLPQEIEPIGSIVSSGPDKLRSGDSRDWAYNVRAVQAGFVSAVVENRELDIPRTELERAKLYPGSVATSHGMIDATGGLQQAIQRAADEAGLDGFDVRTIRPSSSPQFVTEAAYLASDAPNRTLVSPGELLSRADGPTAAPSVMMMPASVLGAAIAEGTANATVETREVRANATVAG